MAEGKGLCSGSENGEPCHGCRRFPACRGHAAHGEGEEGGRGCVVRYPARFARTRDALPIDSHETLRSQPEMMKIKA